MKNALNSLVVFRVDRCHFCTTISNVESILEIPQYTQLPQTAKCFMGTFMFRGEAAGIIDLHCCFDFQAEKAGKEQILVTLTDEKYLAFVVDEVLDVIDNVNLTWTPVPDLLPKKIFKNILLWKDKIVFLTDTHALARLIHNGEIDEMKSWFMDPESTQHTNETDHQEKIEPLDQANDPITTEHTEKADLFAEQAEREEAEQLAAEQAEKEEAERLAAEQAEREEAERLAVEQAEKEEAERLAAEQAEREEAERLAVEQAEKEEAERLATEQTEREEAERLATEQTEREEAERLAAEQAEREEAERLAAEQAEREEAERLAAEQAEREEAERLAVEQAEREKAERLAAEQAEREEAERLAAEQAEREEAERLAVEQAEREKAERLAAEQAEREEAERLAAEQAEREEAERNAAEQAEHEEAERLVAEQAEREEAERLAAEQAEREEAERLAAEQAEREEAERIAAEQAEREEAERLAAEQAEREEAERLAAEQAEREEAERLAAEQAEREEGERLAAEQAEQLAAEQAERLAAEQAEREEAERLAVEQEAAMADKRGKQREQALAKQSALQQEQQAKKHADEAARETDTVIAGTQSKKIDLDDSSRLWDQVIDEHNHDSQAPAASTQYQKRKVIDDLLQPEYGNIHNFVQPEPSRSNSTKKLVSFASLCLAVALVLFVLIPEPRYAKESRIPLELHKKSSLVFSESEIKHADAIAADTPQLEQAGQVLVATSVQAAVDKTNVTESEKQNAPLNSPSPQKVIKVEGKDELQTALLTPADNSPQTPEKPAALLDDKKLNQVAKPSRESNSKKEQSSTNVKEKYKLKGENFVFVIQRKSQGENESEEINKTLNDDQYTKLMDKIVHVVITGDTLWDISSHYLKNPYRYPEVAEISQIKNPDLIYPGDRIIILKRNQDEQQ